MLNYYLPLYDNNYVYSLDMIRINFELNDDLAENFDKFVNDFSFDQGCELFRFISTSGFNYKYLYRFSIEDFNKNKCSFSIGLCLGCKSENKNKGFIEFNPNKCYLLESFNKYFELFKSLCFSFKLVRYDLAIDLPVKRDKVKLIRNSKCNYEFYREFKKDGNILNSSITEYQGRRNHNKFTKLYDKTAESNLDYDLTRIEFTFDRDEVEYKNIPDFYLDSVFRSVLDDSDNVLISLLLSSDDINLYLKRLSKYNRLKIKSYLKANYVTFNYDIFKQLRKQALSYEF